MEITGLLIKIAEILERLNIHYLVTGGVAVSVWGRTRHTADIDIIIELQEKDIDRLSEELLLIDKVVYVDKDMIRDALKRKSEFNLIDPSSGVKVDFWIMEDTAFARSELERAVKKEIDDQKISFISPEDLILSKLLWHKESESTRHLEDIGSIFKISKIDLEYIKDWAGKQSTAETLERLLNKDQK